jgi:hypothetical protein
MNPQEVSEDIFEFCWCDPVIRMFFKAFEYHFDDAPSNLTIFHMIKTMR